MPHLFDNIYIHTYGRSYDQATYHALPQNLQAQTWLVVQNRESKLYTDYDNVIVLPKGIKRLSPTRQWLVENAEGRYICMMDDDFVNFGYRRDEFSWHLSVATDAETNRLFSWCRKQLDKYAHAGLSPRVQNHTCPENFKIGARMTQMLCYDLKVLRDNDFRFDRMPCMQDFDMTLQLLLAGYPNIVNYRGCTNARSTPTKRSREEKGGCEAYRTPSMQSAAARKLQRLHGERYVRLREKTTGEWDEPVTDVTVYWKRACKEGEQA